MRNLALALVVLSGVLVVGCSKGADDATAVSTAPPAAPAGKSGSAAGTGPIPKLANAGAVPQLGSKAK